MPICKLVTHIHPQYQQEGLGKFFDEESYESLYHYLTKENSNDSKNMKEKRNKMPQNLHGARCLDYARAPQEMAAVSKAFGKNKGKKLRHYVMSLSPEECNILGADHDSCCIDLADIAEHFLDCFHNQYQCFYCIHKDTMHPHVHICQSTVNFKTGKKDPGDKASYFSIVNQMNQYLHNEYGLHLRMIADES